LPPSPRLPGNEPMTVHTPIETRPGIPRWSIGLVVFVFLVGAVYVGSNLSGTNPPIAVAASGSPGAGGGGGAALAIISTAGCKSCHGPDLAGVPPTFPDLHGLQNGPTVANLAQLGKDHPKDWMNIWITGTDPAVSNPAMRKGMPAFGGQLTPAQIETVVQYLLTLK
jgi:mono/diheme cytochrome c family protein